MVNHLVCFDAAAAAGDIPGGVYVGGDNNILARQSREANLFEAILKA